MSKVIVGLCGSAGVGKDTTADRLVRKWGFQKLSLADPMKEMVKEIYGFSDYQLWGPSGARNEPDSRYKRPDGTYLTPREALQTLGTEFGRRCWPDTWISLALKRARRMAQETHVVIPDVRFSNELDAIQAAGGKVVRLRRSTAVDPLAIGVAGHASEAEQLQIPDSRFDMILNLPEGLDNAAVTVDLAVPRLLGLNVTLLTTPPVKLHWIDRATTQNMLWPENENGD